MRRLRGRAGRTALILGLAFVMAVTSLPGATSTPSTQSAAPTPIPPATGTAEVAAPVAATSSLPIFDWGLAFILYGPGDDSTHFMGEGAAMVTDDHTRNITTFGGEGSGGLINYTVNYNYSTGSFNVTDILPGPTARTNASFGSDPASDFAVLFGGLTNLTTQTTTNDTWVYYFDNQTWRNVTQAIAPPAREGAAFAVNGSGPSALLEGGWDPSATINGSPATVFWNDTWSLNLTTLTWTQLHPASAPPPLYGSSLIWQNATHRYDLFGGCALECSSNLWTFSGAPGDWATVSTSGTPAARGSAAFVWDRDQGVGILEGGFAWGDAGAVALGTDYLFAPLTDSWSVLQAIGGPGPVYDAPNTWADFPGCVGFLTVGGNTALLGPPLNASVLSPAGEPSLNCFPNLISGGGSPPPPPCSVQSVPLEIRVDNNLTGVGIPNATVSFTGGCIANQVVQTDRYGEVDVTLPAPDVLNFTARAPGYRSRTIEAEFLPNTSNIITIDLSPYPSITVRAFGQNATSLAPLDNVSVVDGTFEVLGTTNFGGWFNLSVLQLPQGPATILGILANYSKASTGVQVPFSGHVWANLTLDAAGPLDVEFVSNSTGQPLANVSAQLKDVDLEGPGFLSFTSGANGWHNFSREVAGNYSVTSMLLGYGSNVTAFDHVWIDSQVVVVRLVPLLGGTLDVLVRSSSTRDPIGGAFVELVTFGNRSSSSDGWANFTGVEPPALYELIASAAGYRSNFTFVSVTYGSVIAPFPVLLTLLPPCPGSPGCLTSVTGTSPPAFGYLNGGTVTTLIVFGTPAALLLAGLAYVVVAPRRGRSSSPPAPPARRGTG
ncbi:MAG: hypothetical protein L3K16_01165 [Thermoplasmata archaeon]|nr:hypothetical protein [Thermoplasmata archaeon]